MRRIVLVLVLVGVLAIAGYMLLRPKHGPAQSKSTKAAVQDATKEGAATAQSAVKTVTSGGKSGKSGKSGKGGKVTGALKATSKEQRRAQTKKIRDEERRRKKELKRQEREKRRMLKGARARVSRRKGNKGGGYYVLKAIILLGDNSYVLIDSRRATVGDIVMGRKIVEIGQDRIEVEAFGRRSTVRVGESLLPSSYSPKRR